MPNHEALISECLELLPDGRLRCRNRGIVFAVKRFPVRCCGPAVKAYSPPATTPHVRTLPASAFVPTSDLVADTLALMPRLSPDIDAVVGIARSGLIPAGLLAVNLHLPLYALSQSRKTIIDVGHGVRLDSRNGRPLRKVLLVDDTVAKGRAMAACAPLVKQHFPGAEVVRAAIYVDPQATNAIDLAAVLYPIPHYLEWNLWNAGHGAAMACDFDGILCEDVPAADDDDGPRYAVLLPRIAPKYLPRRRPIPLIVTGRLEKWRAVTEEWLRRWGIRWGALVMHPGEFRDRTGESSVMLKADAYAASKCETFIESDPAQARQIAERTGRPVVCPAAREVFGFAPPKWLESRAVGCGPPPLAQQAWNLATSLAAFVADGCKTVDSDQYAARLAICDACEFRRDTRCLKCGCNLALKAKGRAFTCPAGKWPEVP